MNKPNRLQLVHSTNKQLLSDDLIRAIVLTKDEALAESIIKKIKYRAFLKPVNQSTQ
ncbi:MULTISPECIES: hypothetical protein [unclassified Methylophaga]|jgi:hypothetical protein|nr:MULTISPECIES: hypothetical protein [unclassified Methylophaga]|tara:strand:+ start:1059 stop:1229 length:171 start_codon:yes stop_codon:yes gene_type:complete